MPERSPAGDGRRAGPVRGTETVLVVEDDPNVRDLVRLLLEHNGYTVLTVQDAHEAERACTELGVDLLLTDVVMPEVSGRRWRSGSAGRPDVRILFMSGYSDEAVHRHGILSAGPRSSRSRLPSGR